MAESSRVMTLENTLDRLRRSRVIPVIRTKDSEAAIRVSRALLTAGFHTVEIALTTPGAVAVIEDLASRPEWLIGAGTVLSIDDGERVIAAGARYVVSPCAVDGLGALCRTRQVAHLPGATTPSEVFGQSRAGAMAVKIYPAHLAGGPGYLRTLKSVFPDIMLVPTGGIRSEDVEDYLAAGAMAVGMGRELLPADLIAGGTGDEIRDAAQDLIETWSERWNFTPCKEYANV